MILRYTALLALTKGELFFEKRTDQIPKGFPSIFNCENTNERIIGGAESNVAWPFLATIRTWKDLSTREKRPHTYDICGAAIISDRWLLTAGHCCTSKQKYREMVFGQLGYDDWKFKIVINGNDNLHVHPEYGAKKVDKSKWNSDLCLIQMPYSIDTMRRTKCGGAMCAKTVCLPTKPERPGAACWVAGFGLDDVELETFPDHLKSVGLNIFSPDYLRNKTPSDFHDELVYRNEFSAGIPDEDGDGLTDGGSDACMGDSGGPLVCREDDKLVVYGIVSWGLAGCGTAGYPGVYAAVYPEMTWIDEIMTTKEKPAMKPEEELSDDDDLPSDNRPVDDAKCDVEEFKRANRGEGEWSCKEFKGKKVFCKHKCGHGYYTGAKSSCKMNGKKSNVWKTKKASKAICNICPSDPASIYPFEGMWMCRFKDSLSKPNTKCKGVCPNGKKVKAKVTCRIRRDSDMKIEEMWSIDQKGPLECDDGTTEARTTV